MPQRKCVSFGKGEALVGEIDEGFANRSSCPDFSELLGETVQGEGVQFFAQVRFDSGREVVGFVDNEKCSAGIEIRLPGDETMV